MTNYNKTVHLPHYTVLVSTNTCFPYLVCNKYIKYARYEFPYYRSACRADLHVEPQKRKYRMFIIAIGTITSQFITQEKKIPPDN